MNDIMQRMREKLRADWKVFGVLAFLHTALALTVFGPTMIKLLMEVH